MKSAAASSGPRSSSRGQLFLIRKLAMSSSRRAISATTCRESCSWPSDASEQPESKDLLAVARAIGWDISTVVISALFRRSHTDDCYDAQSKDQGKVSVLCSRRRKHGIYLLEHWQERDNAKDATARLSNHLHAQRNARGHTVNFVKCSDWNSSPPFRKALEWIQSGYHKRVECNFTEDDDAPIEIQRCFNSRQEMSKLSGATLHPGDQLSSSTPMSANAASAHRADAGLRSNQNNAGGRLAGNNASNFRGSRCCSIL